MSAKHTILILIITIAVILAVGCTRPAADLHQEQKTEQVVSMTNPVAPVPVESTNGVNIAYELELRPAAGMEFVPESIDVIDPATGTILYTPDAEVFARCYMPAASPLPTADEMMEGTLKVPVPRISIWFTVRPDAVPDKLIHRLTMNGTASGLSPATITGGEVIVRKDLKPVILGSPMRGAGWVAMETTKPTTHHFLMPVTINGKTTVDQRYAQDWIFIDPVTGQAGSDGLNVASDFFGYGKELLAVADGTVVDVRDGVPDNGIYKVPPFSFANGTGNNVLIDIGDDKAVGYCHMIPGSIRVKKGDLVKEGQVIGLLGNSGMSDVPHLHIEVVTGKPTIIGGEGYPFVFREFDLIAMFNQSHLDERATDPTFSSGTYWAEFGDFIDFTSQPVPQQNLLQENLAIVRFP